MNYRIDVMPGHWFKVVENTSEQVVKVVVNHAEAKKLLRFLNMGGGFDGWTPAFMLKKIEIPVSDNY